MNEPSESEMNVKLVAITGIQENFFADPKGLIPCHQAEKGLTPEQSHLYFMFIKADMGQPPEGDDVTIRDFYIHASAPQRALALCEVFGITKTSL